MTSTSAPAVAHGSALTERSVPAHLAPGGFLGRHPGVAVVLFLLGALIFGLLAVNVRMNGPLLAWDLPIDQALHLRATHDFWLDFDAMRFSGTMGREPAAIITALLGLYWLWKRHWHKLSLLVIGVIGGNIWFELLSHLFGRHRPVFPDPLDPLPGPGFPSGHSMTGVLLYGLILYLLLPRLSSWRWRLLAALDAGLILILIGYSRLYMGAHYPTDVLAGAAFGLAWGALVYTSLELYHQRRRNRQRRAPA